MLAEQYRRVLGVKEGQRIYWQNFCEQIQIELKSHVDTKIHSYSAIRRKYFIYLTTIKFKFSPHSFTTNWRLPIGDNTSDIQIKCTGK